MPESRDVFNLKRFVDAQQPVYQEVTRELRAGSKRGHWMWFVFPQMKGLGHSSMAQHYGIGSREEALAYLQHPVLGPRLEEATRLLLGVDGKSISQILGYPDDLKLRSSMTLFSQVASEIELFQSALQKYFEGKPDGHTLELLGRDWDAT